MPEPFRLRFVNQIVGVFVLAILAVVFAFLLLLVRAKGRTSDHVEFEIRTKQDDLGGLRIGTEVQILGKTSGRIDRIDYVGEGNQVVVGLAIKERFARQILTNSTVRVRHGHGAPFLEVLRGDQSDTALVDVATGEPIEIHHFQSDQDRIDELAGEIRELRKLLEKSLADRDTKQ
ncbi:MAG TPA: MlaD family protein [Pirellulales bacterium]|nr:MlaD family protein [Pirellulales bacterium]